jgi:PAS domain S-box-containing protein
MNDHHNQKEQPEGGHLRLCQRTADPESVNKGLEREQTEEALRKSEERFSKAFNLNPSPMSITKVGDGRFLAVNESFLRVLGFKREEVIGLTPLELNLYVDPNERAKVLDTLDKEKRESQPEIEIRSKSGEVLIMRFAVEQLEFDDEECIIATAVDITEGRLAQEALRESEQRYRSLFKNNHSVMLLIDPESAEIVDANPAELTSMKITDINMLPNEQVFQEIERAKSEARNHFFFRHRLANEEIRDVEVYSGPIRLHGKELLYSIIHDITERKRAEEELRESEGRYRLLVETMNEGMALANQDYVFTYVNERFCEMLGYSRDEMMEHHLMEFLDDDQKELMKDQVDRRKRGEEERYELAWRAKDGRKICTMISPRGFFDEAGQFTGGLGVVTDITERKRAEEGLRQYAERLRIFHEIDSAILAAQSPQEIAEAALSQIRSLIPILSRASVAVLDVQTNEVTVLAVHTNGATNLGPEARFSVEEFGVPEKLYRGELNLVEDSLAQPQPSQVDQALQAEGMRSYINVPLFFQGELIGTLNFGAEEPGAFTQEYVEIAQEVAGQLAVAIQNARLFNSVTQQREELRALAVRLEEMEEAERRRFAQELHDSVGQNLTALDINLNVMNNLLPSETETGVRDRLDDCLNLVDETADRIRNVMAELRPSVLDDYGLVAALCWHAERFSERTGVATLMREEELEGQLPPAVEAAIFRIAQEALTNIGKHAKASLVTLQLKDVAGGVRFTVADDGVGFDPKILRQPGGQPGWGLVTMRERGTAVGGHLSVNSEPGKGTQVVLEVRR